MIFRRAVSLLTVPSLVLALGVGASAQAVPPPISDDIRGFTILPPGSGAGLHAQDQVGDYAALVDDDGISDEELDDYFHAFQLEPQTIEREYSPDGREDVTVYRDALNVPHVYADSDDAASFALGYVSAEDRLWQMDLLRHAGLGRLSELLGPERTSFDKVTRRDTYSKKQLNKMLARLDDRFGAEGEIVQSAFQSYADGVNAYIDEIQDGTRTKPIEYFVQRVEVRDWQPTDSLAAAILQIRSFGSGGGQEMENAAALRGLQDRLGDATGREVFDDLYYRNDPDAPATVAEAEGVFPSQQLGDADPKAVAIPDNPQKVVAAIEAARTVTETTLERIGLGSPASHFIAVSPADSVTGNPLQWGGPQVGYTIPAPFMEVATHTPSIDSRGMALPGAAIVPAVGRGISKAWSLTTGTSDLVDTFVEKLCHPRKNKVPNRSKYYKHDGRCKKMTKRTESFSVKEEDGFTKKFFRTTHGAVVAWAKVEGKPVAVTQARSYHKREIDFVMAVYRINLNATDEVSEVSDALSLAPMSFNLVYTDADDIAYFHVGRYPTRADGVDPKLPTWGKGKFDWNGFMPWDEHPNVTNPARGFIANWNNKPSEGWDSSDASNWGPTQRVQLLNDKLETALDGAGQLDLAGLVDIIRRSATQDSNALRLADRVLPEVAPQAGPEQLAFDLLQTWVDDGAHRTDKDRDTLQDSGAAVALWDRLYDNLVHGVFDDELGDLYSLVRIKVADDAPNSNGSSYFFDYSNYLWHLFGGNQDRYSRDYCHDIAGPATSCSEIIQSAFSAAVAELVTEQGPDPSLWTWPADYIEFSALGGQSTDPIPWQNRGTYNHAVEIGVP